MVGDDTGIYEFECQNCGNTIMAVLSRDKKEVECPICGNVSEIRVIGAI